MNFRPTSCRPKEEFCSFHMCVCMWFVLKATVIISNDTNLFRLFVHLTVKQKYTTTDLKSMNETWKNGRCSSRVPVSVNFMFKGDQDREERRYIDRSIDHNIVGSSITDRRLRAVNLRILCVLALCFELSYSISCCCCCCWFDDWGWCFPRGRTTTATAPA